MPKSAAGPETIHSLKPSDNDTYAKKKPADWETNKSESSDLKMSTAGKEVNKLNRIEDACGKIKASISELEQMLSDRNYEVRMRALEGLASFDRENLKVNVREAIHDRNDLVRTTAIEVAADQYLVGLKSEVIARLRSDKSWLVRSAAAVALGDMGILDATAILEQSLRKASDEERVRLTMHSSSWAHSSICPTFSMG